MDFDNLWIGDEVFIKSLQRSGQWEGRQGRDAALIRIGHDRKLIKLSDLGPAPSGKKLVPDLDLGESTSSTRLNPAEHPSELDLHIEKLAPDRINDLPEMILNYQMKRCREFVENALRSHRPSILIIHGKGAGVLRSEVLHYLEGLKEVKFMFPKKDGGATEVWFSW